jgi:hypothetical protein
MSVVMRIVAALALLAFVSCKAQRAAFYDKVYTCNPNAPGSCGTTESGRPMTCYSAVALGGTGVCAETCDPASPALARSGVACASMTVKAPDAGAAETGALLLECDPTADAGCPDGLACYRTELISQAGVCLPMPVCDRSAECTQTRPICAADVVRMAVPGALAAGVATDNLHCLAAFCKSAGTQCPPGEGCIGNFLSFGLPLDDLCVPRCDVNNACPPNFTCLQDARWAPGAAPICFPGMIGTRCAEPDDCLLGTCTDVGDATVPVEFKVCTIPCQNNQGCAMFNTASDVYLCSNGHCLTTRPFSGSNCAVNEDCIAAQKCVGGSVVGEMKHGECRTPCDADGQCPARGGLPHVCLGKDREGLCFPSSFATPCRAQADCIANFKCLAAAPDARSPDTAYATQICTVTCATDADCDAEVFTKKLGFCQEGLCRIAGGEDVPCERNAQCGSKRCMNGKCLTSLTVNGTTP